MFLGYTILQLPEFAKLAHKQAASMYEKRKMKNNVTPIKCENETTPHNNSCSDEEDRYQIMMTSDAKNSIHLILDCADRTNQKVNQIQISTVDINRSVSLLLKLKESDIYRETRI